MTCGQGYVCKRPSIADCSEAQFYDDLVEFLTLLRGKPIDRARFPDAVLNGLALDLFHLYKEVVSRGGFRCVRVAARAQVPASVVSASTAGRGWCMCVCARVRGRGGGEGGRGY